MQFEVKKVDFKFFEKNLFKYYFIDFPEEERCPVDRLKIIYSQEKIEILALFKEDILYGYAIFLLNANKNNCMIWYLAVIKEYRNKGIGTELLKLLKSKLKHFDNIILEVERRNCGANSDENVIREKRFNFYIKSGMKLSDLKVQVYGVDYEIFLFDECKSNVDTLFEIYKDIYYNIRNKEIIDKRIVKVL